MCWGAQPSVPTGLGAPRGRRWWVLFVVHLGAVSGGPHTHWGSRARLLLRRSCRSGGLFFCSDCSWVRVFSEPWSLPGCLCSRSGFSDNRRPWGLSSRSSFSCSSGDGAGPLPDCVHAGEVGLAEVASLKGTDAVGRGLTLVTSFNLS